MLAFICILRSDGHGLSACTESERERTNGTSRNLSNARVLHDAAAPPPPSLPFPFLLHLHLLLLSYHRPLRRATAFVEVIIESVREKETRKARARYSHRIGSLSHANFPRLAITLIGFITAPTARDDSRIPFDSRGNKIPLSLQRYVRKRVDSILFGKQKSRTTGIAGNLYGV